jgi:hypothetical protein
MNRQMEQTLKRAWILLEDKEWDQAVGYFNSVLATDAENASSYVGLLCADLRVPTEELLAKCGHPLEEHKHYKKAIRFADADLHLRLEGYNEAIKRYAAEKIPALAEARKKIEEFQGCIAAGYKHTAGLKTDGTVVAVGDRDACKTAEWRGITAICAGPYFTLGLKADGTVVSAGSVKLGNSGEWYNITTICASDNNTVGLKADGTVVAVGKNSHGQRELAAWQDIITISAGDRITVGLEANGTVVMAGSTNHGKYKASDLQGIGPADGM